MKQFYKALVWSAVILVLSLLPGKAIPKVGWSLFIAWDKLAHMTVYAVLAVLVATGWSSEKSSKAWKGVYIVLICSVYGLLMEGVQYYFLSDRFFEIHDIIANIIGSIVGTVIVFSLLKK